MITSCFLLPRRLLTESSMLQYQICKLSQAGPSYQDSVSQLVGKPPKVNQACASFIRLIITFHFHFALYL